MTSSKQTLEVLYFDTCVLNRLRDDSLAERVRKESEASVRLLEHVSACRVRWVTSTVVRQEVLQTPDAQRRAEMLDLLDLAAIEITPDLDIISAVSTLTEQGIGSVDALHLAICEQVNVTWLVTTDDKFMRAAQRLKQQPHTILINPVDLSRRRFPWLVQKK